MEQFINLQQASDYLKIHVMTAYRYAKTKSLPIIKVGGRYRTKISWLDEYLLKGITQKAEYHAKKTISK